MLGRESAVKVLPLSKATPDAVTHFASEIRTQAKLDHPNLAKLEDGNLVHHTDFRQVYATVLEKWLGVPSKDVLGGEYKQLELFNG